MNKPDNFISKMFAPIKPLSPGIYHYQAPPDNPDNYRLHLRIEPDGNGLLVINASTVLHLNQTAAEYAYHIVNQTPEKEVISSVKRRYRTKREEVINDFTSFSKQIDLLIHTIDLEPVSYLEFERQAPYSRQTSAPYRLDCALTYRLPEGASQDAAPIKRVDRELSTEEWKSIIDRSWAAGIPHLIFTGGEPTLREDLVELIAYAESLGQVTGLLTNGIKLGDTKYLQAVLEAGLDHVMILLEPDHDASWDSLASFSYWKETLDDDIFVCVHLTITSNNHAAAFELVDKLAQAGVSAISLSTNDPALTSQLEEVREHVDEQDIELIWDIPVPYSNLNPVALELELDDDKEETFQGAGRAWLYVEPDGDVLPGQGINHLLGNFLNDQWESIWAKASGHD
ncbi:MAG: radical SAM protein [Chloroflexota bacterium]